jgi:hypothetical protein
MKVKKTKKIILVITLAALGSLVLSACGASEPTQTPTPTIGMEAIQTSAVSTFAAGLTQTAIAQPTNTPTYTPTFTPTSTAARNTPFPGGGVVPTASCFGLLLVSDVTIPDHAPMTPGQTFTKTWKVKNIGSCAWEADFKFAFKSGEAMGGTTQVLGKVVSPGGETDISIPMTAPNKTGVLQGNWQMSNSSGTFFNNVVWIIINMSGGTTTVTSTGTVTATTGATTTKTVTPTATFTPTSTSVPIETETFTPTSTSP